MAIYQITHVRVQSPETRAEHVTQVKLAGGTVETREQAHDYIKKGHEYYYTIGGGRHADVEAVTTVTGTKYIRTKADNTTKDNLLNLPRF